MSSDFKGLIVHVKVTFMYVTTLESIIQFKSLFNIIIIIIIIIIIMRVKPEHFLKLFQDISPP
jgi:mannitol/fructose-specific phosphotransferase system IIA component (Ntr-type)